MNGVYCLTFPNGKRYVGKSTKKNGAGIETRWQAYRRLDLTISQRNPLNL